MWSKFIRRGYAYWFITDKVLAHDTLHTQGSDTTVSHAINDTRAWKCQRIKKPHNPR